MHHLAGPGPHAAQLAERDAHLARLVAGPLIEDEAVVGFPVGWEGVNNVGGGNYN